MRTPRPVTLALREGSLRERPITVEASRCGALRPIRKIQEEVFMLRRTFFQISGFGPGLVSMAVALGCSSSGPAQGCFQGSATSGLVCKAGQAMTDFKTTEPSTTPTQGEGDVDDDGKADAFLCVSQDRNDDSVADVEQTGEHEDGADDGETEDDGRDCEAMRERGKTDGDNDKDGVGDSEDPDDDNDGVADADDSDKDGDGIPNADDTDNDNDGVPNLLDSK